jgi:hypothetical protein
MDDLPDPDSALEILSQATYIKESRYAADATSMIRSGFILVGIAMDREPGHETSFVYSLIWTKPVKEVPEIWR